MKHFLILISLLTSINSFAGYREQIEYYRNQLTATSTNIQQNLAVIDRNLENCTMFYERIRDQFISEIGTQVKIHSVSIQGAVDVLYGSNFCDGRGWQLGVASTNRAIQAISSGLGNIAQAERDYDLEGRISTDCSRIIRDKNVVARIEREQRTSYAAVKAGLRTMSGTLNNVSAFFNANQNYRCRAPMELRTEQEAILGQNDYLSGRSFFPVYWGPRR